MICLISRVLKIYKMSIPRNRRTICSLSFNIPNFLSVDWNKDWAAGPHPKTEAECDAAAKKYGLLPEDYKPYPDDGEAFGDYPELPLKGVDSRDPYEDYDFPSLRRNYGDPVGSKNNLLRRLSSDDLFKPEPSVHEPA